MKNIMISSVAGSLVFFIIDSLILFIKKSPIFDNGPLNITFSGFNNCINSDVFLPKHFAPLI